MKVKKKNEHNDKIHRHPLLIKPGTKWHEVLPYEEIQDVKPCPPDEVRDLKLTAQKLHNQDVLHYKNFLHTRKERSDFNWIHTVLRTGTLADKMAAHTVLIQDSAIYNLASIDTLVGMVNVKGKRECLLAIDTLRDLFLSDLLVEDKKLKTFEMHPFGKLDEMCSGNIEVKNRRLLLWYFEDQLKQKYMTFLKAVERISHDTVETSKQKAITVMSQMLRFNPEQEQFLLANLINKLGDPSKRIAARVVGHMNQVVETHPNMKGVIIDEMERLLYRPNVGARAQYYVLCFLSQLIFDAEDKKAATHLIRIYFGFFKMCVKRSEVDSKMMSALLTGVSRAFPYMDKSKTSMLEEQLDSLYKVIHMVKFNIRVQALMLILQALDTSEGLSDRFYLVLYRILADSEVANCTRQATFLNLLYRALKKDPLERRVKAFIKRLLQMCQYYPSCLVCGVLFLVSEIVRLKPSLLSVDRKALQFQDDDEDEHYEDAPEETDDEVENHRENSKPNRETTPISSSWVHVKNLNSNNHDCKTDGYDPFHRNPLYCKAENEALWELSVLQRDFHPSVALFAKNVTEGTKTDYSGDPLQDFTLIHFLDRFVYRNPKEVKKKDKSEKTDGHKRIFGRRTLYVPKGSRSLAVTSDAYVNQKKEKVPVEEQFLYQYVSQRAAKKKVEEGKGGDEDDDMESVASDEFERFLDRLEPGTWDNVDFAGGVKKGKKKGRKMTREEEDFSDEGQSEEDDGGSGEDEEVDFGNDEEFQKAFEDFDEDLVDVGKGDFDFEDIIEEESSNKRKLGSKSAKKENKKKKRGDSGALFASAEQFSSLLDEHSGSKLDTTTAQAMANKDNADAKQLAWEMARDKWVRGVNWKAKKGKAGRFQKFRGKKPGSKTKKFRK